MDRRLIKETRDLLPAFAVTLLLIVAPFVLIRGLGTDARQVLQGIGLLALGVACVVMGGSSFGNEFQHRTLPLLLSQPIARSVLWRDKMLVLGAGMMTSMVVLAACEAVWCPVHDREGWVMLVLIPLGAFCGAPYWTLLLRHGIGGMVFSVAIPAWIMAMAALVAEHLGGGEGVREVLFDLLLLLFVSYCALVYWLGYAKFARLEALDGPSRELNLPAGLEAIFVRPLSNLAARFRSPFATLLKKEFRLQQISFLLAGVFVLIAVAGFCLIKHRPEVAAAIVGGDYIIYMVILPLIAGAISLGEEKGWGMAEWHLTLPPSALKQWSAKMLATLSTSLALGLILPAVLVLAGQRLLGQHDIADLQQPVPVICGWVLAQMTVTSVAVYTASLSRSTLRAMLGAVALIAAGGGVFAVVASQGDHIFPRVQHWIGPIHVAEEMVWPLLGGAVICLLCVLLCLMQGLACFNFRRHGPAALRGLVQCTVLLLLCWVLSVGYLTVWDLLANRNISN